VWWLPLVMWTAAVIGDGANHSNLQLRSISQKNRHQKTFLLAPVRRF
jgi:hypothetical protein